MKTAIVGIGTIVTGDLVSPFVTGDTIVMQDDVITAVGSASAKMVDSCDVVIDAAGATAIPGLIDSHVHITFGDYTPRQRTVGYLESYLHGGVTSAISASEVHVPGRPTDREGIKALAVAAQRCFDSYRPGGMRVWAGSLILEPGLEEQDFAELAAKGVWLAKAGFGGVVSPRDYAPMVRFAREVGFVTTAHTGGASIPDSAPIHGDDLLEINPHVSFHVNGGPVAMPDADFERLVVDSEIALQICTAGNLRTALLCAELASRHSVLERLLIGTDTPTGSGIMPLGMFYTITHLSSLGGIPPELAICAATGNNATVFRRNSGFLRPGRAADVVVIDAPLGGTQPDALSALAHGDPPAVGAVITSGTPRFVGRSRNTPPTTRRVQVTRCNLPREFGVVAH